jgi:protein gp37
MGENTNIEWADHSWNPWRGCTKVSPGCANCYAETWSRRNPAVLGNWGKGKPRVLAKNWVNPLRWNCTKICTNCGQANKLDAMVCSARSCAHFEFLRPRVFPSLCDWLDEEVPTEWLAALLTLIHETPNLDWLLLTKRPENFQSRLAAVRQFLACDGSYSKGIEARCYHKLLVPWANRNPPNNVWIGTSLEDQKRADERIPALLQIPARLRFLSLEPLLGPIDLSSACNFPGRDFGERPFDWVIIGGESGPRGRPCNVDLIRSIIGQLDKAAVPCFVKQVGSNPCGYWTEGAALPAPDALWKLRVKHPKGGNPEEWPEDLRVRQYPEVHP